MTGRNSIFTSLYFVLQQEKRSQFEGGATIQKGRHLCVVFNKFPSLGATAQSGQVEDTASIFVRDGATKSTFVFPGRNIATCYQRKSETICKRRDACAIEGRGASAATSAATAWPADRRCELWLPAGETSCLHSMGHGHRHNIKYNRKLFSFPAE